jgi:hypothetical protein
MCKAVLSVGILAVLLLLVPTVVLGQRAGKTKEEPASKDDYKALDQLKEIEGELTSLEPSTKLLTLKVPYTYMEPNPQYKPNTKANNAYARKVNRLIQQQQQAMNISNPVKRMQRLQQLANQMQTLQLTAPPGGPSPFRAAVAFKDFDADVPDDVVVRRLTLPLEYDDKGNVKEYTEADKKKLRGNDPKKPGYAATWDDVAVGQKIKLYLKGKQMLADKTNKSGSKAPDKEAVEEKDAVKDKDEGKAAAANKKANVDDEIPEEPRAHAYMVLIETDADPTATPKNNPKKKRQAN